MFTQDDFKFIADVFSLARLQTVTTQPTNRKQLENILLYENIVKDKFTKANEGLGYVEETPVAPGPEATADMEVLQEEPKEDAVD